MHIFDARFPLAAKARRQEPDALVCAYRKLQHALGLELLQSLPCTLVIEHIGRFLEPVGVDHPGFQALLRLLDRGRCWVKLSGADMTSKSGPPLYEDVGVRATALVRYAPERMVWASNWPHPLATAQTRPDEAQLLDLLLARAPARATRQRILADNPAALYGF